MGARLTFLHISDLHFGHGDARTRFDQETVVQRLREDAAAMAKKLGAPDWILVTGDIAFSAARPQYEAATAWLGELVTATGAGADALLSVPGNHDIDRNVAKRSRVAQSVRDALRRNPRDIDEYLQRPDDLKTGLMPKLDAYAEFCADHSPISPERPFWTREVDTALGPVVFAGLDTALLCFDKGDNPTNLMLGKGQLHPAVVKPPADKLLVVLQHHPPGWLGDGREQLSHLGQRPHLLFSGHVHDQGGYLGAGFHGGSLVHLVAGAGHDDGGDAGRHGYAWATLDHNGLSYYPRQYSQKRGCFRPAATDFDLDASERTVFARDRLPGPLRDWLARTSTPSSKEEALIELLKSEFDARGFKFFAFHALGAALAERLPEDHEPHFWRRTLTILCGHGAVSAWLFARLAEDRPKIDRHRVVAVARMWGFDDLTSPPAPDRATSTPRPAAVVPARVNPRPETTEPSRPGRIHALMSSPGGSAGTTAGRALSRLALVLDREKQWGKLGLQCRTSEKHLAFLVHGDVGQDVNLFCLRVQRFLGKECGRHHHIHRIGFRDEFSTNHTAEDWERRLCIDSGHVGLDIVAALQKITADHPVLFILGDRPLRHLADDERDALTTFLARLPRHLEAARPACPIRLLIPIEHHGAPSGTSDPLVQAVLAALQAAAGLQCELLIELGFPTWDDVKTQIINEIKVMDDPFLDRCRRAFEDEMADRRPRFSRVARRLSALIEARQKPVTS